VNVLQPKLASATEATSSAAGQGCDQTQIKVREGAHQVQAAEEGVAGERALGCIETSQAAQRHRRRRVCGCGTPQIDQTRLQVQAAAAARHLPSHAPLAVPSC